ncbi:major facilitator superfamily transporter [Colletotrichum paranaense]|uniref:Major facilitator superfamily transporter n=1 Tax=Colletotrichum paranaense TaxID=1914294 RepID=A0ABQ9S9Y2_9PEZI|nr:major facilitator superfamily transporter [Colletotrichum paranaense]KAK1531197.1 major facilitator superfamily transporter [Colletotrichum paranaense]
MGKITSTSKEEVSVDTIEKGPLPSASSPPASPSSPRLVLETPDEVAMAHPEWRAAEKSLVRKLDVTLMPVIWTLYMFNYLDRNNLAQAKLDKFEADLGLVGEQFNTAVAIFNVGTVADPLSSWRIRYMVAQLPSNMLITRVRPSIYLPCCVLLWSCVSASTAAAKNFSSLVAIRVILGIVEAPFFPGIFYVLSCWYTQKEIAFRTAILYSGMLIATAFSGLIAAAVFAHLDGARGLAGWQWLFIIEGAGSFASAFAALAFLPDYVGSRTGMCSWLMSERELQVAAQRMAADRVSVPEETSSVWRGLGLAVKDARTWAFVCMMAFYLSSHGLNSFFPTIVQGFRLGSNTTTLMLTAPPYLLAAAVALCVAVSSDRRADRGLHIIGPVCVAMLGFVISAATTNRPARYFASFLYLPGAFASTGLIFSWAASVASETPEKRATATSIVCLLAQVGNIWSPYFFRPADNPRYLLAFLLMMMFSVMCIGTVFWMRWSLGRANRRMVEEAEAEGAGRRVRLYIL